MEKELKFRLADRAAHAGVLEALGSGSKAVQKNFYFDSVDGSCAAAGRSALRIRGEGASEDSLEWELTFKLGVSQDGAYFQAHEFNAPVSSELVPGLLVGGEWPAAVWELLPLQKFAENFGQAPLKALGGIVNHRVRCALFGEEVAEVDETLFPDGSIDYEIEVETEQPEQVEAFLKEMASRLGLALENQPLTKFRRFLERTH